MNWNTRRNPIEILVEWAAPAVLGAASGWAAWTLLGNLPAAAFAFAAAMTAGVAAFRLLSDGAGHSLSAFEPVGFDETPDEELLLDDPLVPNSEDSRVVRLFEEQPRTPGEMIVRISNFLEAAPISGEAAPMHRPSDASASLHQALASIRASLR